MDKIIVKGARENNLKKSLTNWTLSDAVFWRFMDLDMVEKCWICYTSKCHIGTLSKVERSEDEREKT